MNKMEFKTLYSRAKTGQLMQWTIIVDGDKFFTREGHVGGVITESSPTTASPTNIGRSNARTAEEQALFEAEARWKKKIKSGGYSENVEQAGEKSYIEPMLAKSAKDYPELLESNFENILLNEKKNGGRATLSKIHKIKSRKGEQIVAVPHIEEDLKWIIDNVPGAVVDFELNNEALRENLNELMKIIRRTTNITPEFLARSKEIVQAHVYDFYCDELPESEPYWKRFNKFKEIFALGVLGKSVVVVEAVEVKSREDIDNFFNEYVSRGGEGAIVRFKNAPYEHKRSKYLLKLKPEEDDEFEFVSCEEGNGNWAGYAKIINLKMKDGKEFAATFKGSQPQAKKFLGEWKSLVGKMVTIKFNAFTGLGVPNYAQFDYNNFMNDKNDKGFIED